MKKGSQLIPIIIILIFSFTSACTASESIPTPTSTLTPSETITNTATQYFESSPTSDCSTPRPSTPTLESPAASPLTHYHMDISLDYAAHTVTVSEIIDYTNNTGGSIADLPLIVPPAHLNDVFNLITLQLDQEHASDSIYMENGVLTIRLAPALGPNEVIQLSLIFTLQLPEGKQTLGYTERQMLLADWYPFIPLNLEGGGWLINPPGTVGEYLSYPLSQFSVNVHISPPDESLVIAASAPLNAREGNCFRYLTTAVRNFSLAVSPEYQVTTQVSNLATVIAYTFPEHSEKGNRAAQLALGAWQTYTEIYGPNQRSFLTIVEADMTDGLECDGLFYLSDWYFKTADETPQNYFELLTVHETAHQWFFGLVANDQANEPWLDEALATYSELLFLESHHPELVNWWWNFRVHSFTPQGYVNSTIYEFNDSRPYINAVYLNGVRFLKGIRQALGDQTFMTFLRNYAQAEENYRHAMFFFDLLAKSSDADISDLLSIYFKWTVVAAHQNR